MVHQLNNVRRIPWISSLFETHLHERCVFIRNGKGCFFPNIPTFDYIRFHNDILKTGIVPNVIQENIFIKVREISKLDIIVSVFQRGRA